MKRGSKSKKSQFYLIAAIVIVFIVISFAVVYNYIYVKKEPQKFYDIGEILKIEGIHVVEHAEYTGLNVNENIDNYLGLFESYLREHAAENFDLIIVYGNAQTGEVQAIRYSTNVSEGGVSLSIGEMQVVYSPPGRIKKEQASVKVTGLNTVEVTLKSGDLSITLTLPILPDNNFAFIMTTSDGFSNYVQTSLGPKKQGE